MGNPNLASIIIGARGTGKTALLARLAQRARAQGWVYASTSAMSGMLDDILERTFEASSDLVSVDEPRRIAGLELGQFFGIQWETLHRAPENWCTKMNKLLGRLAELDTGLLITVDEVRTGLDELKTLVSVYQHFVQEERNVALVMAGLPHKVSALLNDEDISFLRRARRRRLQRIPDYEVRAAFEETVSQGGKTINADALNCVIDEIAGFPYMMQLVGYWAWSSARGSNTIDMAAANGGIVLAREQMREGVLRALILICQRPINAFSRRCWPLTGVPRWPRLLAIWALKATMLRPISAGF